MLEWVWPSNQCHIWWSKKCQRWNRFERGQKCTIIRATTVNKAGSVLCFSCLHEFPIKSWTVHFYTSALKLGGQLPRKSSFALRPISSMLLKKKKQLSFVVLSLLLQSRVNYIRISHVPWIPSKKFQDSTRISTGKIGKFYIFAGTSMLFCLFNFFWDTQRQFCPRRQEAKVLGCGVGA